MKSAFSTYHPIINFAFFCAVIGIGIFMIHPIFLGVGGLAAFTYAVMLGGKGTLKFSAGFLLPMIIIVSIVNVFVNHQGMTILFYTKYSYVTLEAAVYGVVTGLMLAVVLLWFSCYNKIMTSDKILYLFGRIMPSMSLIFSMVMRFVPNYKSQIKKISDSQKCIGRDVSNGTLKEKIRHGIKIISIMFTWALESAIDTADSMRSRGYGLKSRSNFHTYRFDGRDAAALMFLVLLTLVVLVGVFMGQGHIEFYPYIDMAEINALGTLMYTAYVLLCFFPVIAEIKEIIIWRYIQSKI